MNSKGAKSKFGAFDQEVNTFSKVLFSLSWGLSLLMICLKGFDSSYVWVINFVRYFLILSSLIPISVRVHLDLSKTVFSYFISHDSNIPNTLARNSDIPEELGRISYFLTDKTGTLTQNDMVLKKLSTPDRQYSVDDDYKEIKRILNHVSNISNSQNSDSKNKNNNIKND